jgi:hypothetical protein
MANSAVRTEADVCSRRIADQRLPVDPKITAPSLPRAALVQAVGEIDQAAGFRERLDHIRSTALADG